MTFPLRFSIIMNEKLNIQDLIDLLAEKHGMSKKNADSFVKEFFQLIEEALEKDKYVKIKGLGVFKLIDVESRESINVNTGERFEIQGHTKVSFTPDSTLKDIINKPFSHFETVVLNESTVLENTPVDNVLVDNISEDEEEAEQKIEGVTVTSENPQNEEEIVYVEIASKELSEETVSVTSENADRVKEDSEGKADVPTESSVMKCFIGVVILAVLMCTGGVGYLYYPDLVDKSPAKTQVEEIAETKVEKQTDNTALTDSITHKDTAVVTVADTMSKMPVAETTTKKQVVATYIPDSTNYTIVGTETTYTIKPGETLTKVALRFYGTKMLYPYIVKHNSDLIKKPDNVPAGTTIRIPKLVKKQ